MFGLPIGTAYHEYVSDEPLLKDGQILPHVYITRLAQIAIEVQEIDSLHAANVPPAQLCDKVLRTDQRLRLLAAQAPRDWWRPSAEQVSAEHVLQHFHQYSTLR